MPSHGVSYDVHASDGVAPPGPALGIEGAAVADFVSYVGCKIADRIGPASVLECGAWYQPLSPSDRGRECSALERRKLCRFLWPSCFPAWGVS